MNTKLIILLIASLAALSVMIFIIQFLIRRIRNKIATEGKLNISFGILFTTLFLTAAIIASKSIILFAEAVDNINKISPEKLIGESAKTGLLFIGLTATWFIIWYFTIKILSVYVTGKRNDEKEFESDNYPYFLIRGVMMIGFHLCLLPVFEIIIRAFMPNIQIPFYH
jgi:hypothetical protein